MCSLTAPRAAPHPTPLRLPIPAATPIGHGECRLEMRLPTVMLQNRRSPCPKATIRSNSSVFGSPTCRALYEIIRPTWVTLIPRFPRAPRCWFPLCPHEHPAARGAFRGGSGGMFGFPASEPQPDHLGPLPSVPSSMCTSLKPQPKSLSLSLPLRLHSCSVHGEDGTKCSPNWSVASLTPEHTGHVSPSPQRHNTKMFPPSEDRVPEKVCGDED